VCPRLNFVAVNIDVVDASGPPTSVVQPVCFKLIVLRAGFITPASSTSAELVAPFLALYQSRIGRGRVTIQGATNIYCGRDTCRYADRAAGMHVLVHLIESQDFALGWLLSRASLDCLMSPKNDDGRCGSLISGAANTRDRSREHVLSELFNAIRQDLQ
jgi:hypothetical protein